MVLKEAFMTSAEVFRVLSCLICASSGLFFYFVVVL